MIGISQRHFSPCNISIRRREFFLLLIQMTCPLSAGPSGLDWARGIQHLCCFSSLRVRSGSRPAFREFCPVEGIRAGEERSDTWVAPLTHQNRSPHFLENVRSIASNEEALYIQCLQKSPILNLFITVEQDKPTVSPHDYFIPKVREKRVAEDQVALFLSQSW